MAENFGKRAVMRQSRAALHHQDRLYKKTLVEYSADYQTKKKIKICFSKWYTACAKHKVITFQNIHNQEE